MKRFFCLGIGLLILIPSLLSLSTLRKSISVPERLGYKPTFEVVYFTSLEYRYLLSELLFYDAVFYYGSIVDKPSQRPDYLMIANYVDTATRLNAFNIDAYYFGQAILTWDAGMVKDMNVILERGVKRRTWDFYLPFFLGFNYAYFLNDYASAAPYTEIASKLNPQMTFLPNFVSRLYYQADKTERAIQYLKVVYQGTFNQSVRKETMLRISALETIQLLERAVQKYRNKTGYLPAELTDLIGAGILKKIPLDPYGGIFYYDRSDARIKTTSKMAFH